MRSPEKNVAPRAAQKRESTERHRIYKIYKGDVYTAFIRGSMALLGVALQFGVMFLLSLITFRYSILFYFFLETIGILFSIYLVYDNDSYRHFWLVLILLLPVCGLMMYFVWGSRSVNARSRKRLLTEIEATHHYLPDGEAALDALECLGHGQVPCARYLIGESLPLYRNTAVRYYPLGDDMKEDLLSDLRSARKRIWMEYFIVMGGEIWEEIEEILKEKVKEGVDVRLLIDDVGSIKMINRAFRRRMKEIGIRLNIFSPIHRDITKLALNYRNHQKILIVDECIGYTGGINLADEYFNLYPKYGHWKDTAVRLEGEGTQSLIAMFVSMWNYTAGKRVDRLCPENTVRPIHAPEKTNGGFVQPFYCGPLKRRNNTADMVYQGIISRARHYIRIMTPYLVLDPSMQSALIRAAKSGVDVRIYTPHHYDKWYVYQVTESSYGKLLREGVRVFEYLPGFIHAKNLVCDDECAICGSINLDYRSFYFHYEDAVVFYDGSTVKEIFRDFVKTEEVCEEITYEMWKRRPWHKKTISWVLRFCSPLF